MCWTTTHGGVAAVVAVMTPARSFVTLLCDDRDLAFVWKPMYVVSGCEQSALCLFKETRTCSTGSTSRMGGQLAARVKETTIVAVGGVAFKVGARTHMRL